MQVMLYFAAILLTCALTGFLAWRAWRRGRVPGAGLFAGLALCECLLALAESLSMLSPTPATALFWFRIRYAFLAVIPVLWLQFALAYSKQVALSKRLLAGLLIVPIATQMLQWSNSLHGLWAQQEISIQRSGPFWIAQIDARAPGPGYLFHSFYSLVLLLSGIVLLFAAAWRARGLYRTQALLLTGAAAIAVATGAIFTFNLAPQLRFNLFTPGIGLSTLAAAFAIFRFAFLQGPPIAKASHPLQHAPATFMAIFSVMTAGIATLGYLSYRGYERQFRTEVENQLTSIAALKVNELQHWRSERLADAALLDQNVNFTELVRRSLEIPDDADARARLLMWLERIQTQPEYERVFLLDAQGRERASFPDVSIPVAAHLPHDVADVLRTGQVTLLDLHRDVAGGPAYLAVLLPLYAAPDHPLGVLVLHIDPSVYLYPSLQDRPIPSTNAEIALLRREGETVLYLNDLKFRADAALDLRVSLEEEERPAVQAALGREGIVEGINYRGVPVIAAVRAVPDSPWFLVARVDATEVYTPLRERLWQTVFFIGALMAASGAGLGLVLRQQRERYYRRQAEATQALRESEEKFRYVFDHSIVGKSITLPSGEISVNQAFCDMLGYACEELQSQYWQEITHPDDLALAHRMVDLLLSGEQTSVRFTKRYLHRSGAVVWADVSTFLRRDEAGRPLYFMTSVSDITDLKRAEAATRARLELVEFAAAHLVDEVLQRAIDLAGELTDSPVGFYHLVEEDQKTLSLQAWSTRTLDEFCRAEGKGMHYSIDQVGVWVDCARTGEPVIHNDVPGLPHRKGWPEGHVVVQRELVIPILRAGKVVSILGVGNKAADYTEDDVDLVTSFAEIAWEIIERKQTEQALQFREARFRTLVEVSAAGMWITDAAGNNTYISPQWSTITGISAEEAKGRGWMRGLHPDDRDMVARSWQQAEAAGRPFIADFRFIHPDGRIVWVLCQASSVKDQNGNVIEWVGVMTDITALKQAEDALRTNQALLSTTQQLVGIGGWEWDVQAHTCPVAQWCELKDVGIGGWEWDVQAQTMTWTEQVYRLHDMEPGDTPSLSPEHIEKSTACYAEADRPVILAAFQRCVEQGKPYDLEVPFTTVLGRRLWIRTAAQSVWAGGHVVKVTGHIMDITERKQAEEALRAALEAANQSRRALLSVIEDQKHVEAQLQASEQTLRLFVEHAPASIAMFDREMRYLATSRRYVADFRLGEPDLTGRSHYEVFPETTADQKEIHRRCLAGEVIKSDEDPLPRVDGRVDWVRYELHPWHRDNGDIGGVLFFSEVITERKRAAEALRESEERFRGLYENSTIGLYRTTPDGRILLANPALVKMLGYPSFEARAARNLTREDYEPTYQRSQFLEAIEKEGEVRDMESGWTRPNGTTIFVRESARAIRDAQGATLYYDGTVEDITERKRAEEALRESETLLSVVFEIVPNCIYIKSLEGTYLFANRAIAELYGTTPEYMVGKTDMDFAAQLHLTQAEAEASMQNDRQVIISKQKTQIVEEPFTRLDGTVHWFQTTKLPISLTGDPDCVLGVSVDITERRRAEAEVRRNAEQLATTIAVQHALAATLDERTIWENLGQGVGRLFPDVSTIFISGYDSERALISAVYGLQDGKLVDLGTLPPIPLSLPGRGTQSQVIRTRQPLVIATGLKEKVSQGNVVVRVGEGEEDTQSALYVPMLIQDDVLGVIQLQSYAPNRFREADTRLLSLVANTAAVSLQNARLYELAQNEIAVRQRAENALRESEKRFRSIFEDASVGMAVQDPAGRYVQVNPALCQTLGYSEVELLAKSYRDITHPEDVSLDLEYDQAMLDGRIDAHPPEEKRYIVKDGSTLWALVSASLVRDDQRQPLYRIIQIQDITARKQAEALIERQMHELKTLYEASQHLKRTLDLKEIYRTIHHFIAQTMPCSGLFISAFDADTALITCRAAWNDGVWLDVADFPPIPLEPEGQGTQSVAIRTGQSLLFNDYEKHFAASSAHYYVNNEGTLYEEVPDDAPRTRAALIVPLVVEGRVTEVIQVFSDDLNAFSEDHLRLLESLAVHIASSVQNAVLYEAAQREIAERKRTEAALAASERQFRELFQAIPACSFTFDRQGVILNWNHACEALYGWTAQEAIGQSMFGLMVQEKNAPQTRKHIAAVFEGQNFNGMEFEDWRADGSSCTVLSNEYPLVGSDGAVLFGVCAELDITERKEAERKLRESETMLRLIFEHAFDGISIHQELPGRRRRLIDCNERYADMAGRSKQELLEIGNTSSLQRNIEPQRDTEENIRLRLERASYQGVFSWQRPDNKESVIEYTAAPIQMGDLALTVGIDRDVTERRRTEAALRESEHKLRTLFEIAPVGISILDADRKVTYANHALERILDISTEGLINGSYLGRRYIRPDGTPMPPKEFASVRATTEQGIVRDVETGVVKENGSIVWISVSAAPVAFADWNVVIITVDVTARKEAEDARRESEERYRRLFEVAPVGITVHVEGQIVFTNPTGAQLLGATSEEEIIGRPLREIIHPDKLAAAGERIQRMLGGEQGLYPVEDVYLKLDGTPVDVEVMATTLSYQGKPAVQTLVTDITERKRAEELLRQYTEQLEALVVARTRALEEAQERLLRQERLTVLGQIAGGIAHELRTPLGAIKNSIYLLNMLVEPADATVQEALAVINQGIGTSDRIVSSLLNFTRPQRPARHTVNLNQVIEQVLSRIEIPPQIQVQRPTGGELPTIGADAGQLEQIFGNLILNATQAMPQGGRLTIQTGQVPSLPENVANGFMPQVEGNETGWIVVSVSDSGTGIAPEHMAQLFQPLFTTKARGMGLGLALVKLLTEANGGGIVVESTLGQGTTFHTYWPIVTQ